MGTGTLAHWPGDGDRYPGGLSGGQVPGRPLWVPGRGQVHILGAGYPKLDRRCIYTTLARRVQRARHAYRFG